MQDYYIKVAKLAYRVAQEALPKHPKTKSPHHFTLPQLAACVLLQFYFGFNFRQMEQWLYENKQICRVLELSQVPDKTTLYRTVKLLRIADLEKIKRRLWTGGLADFPQRMPAGPEPAPSPVQHQHITQLGGCLRKRCCHE